MPLLHGVHGGLCARCMGLVVLVGVGDVGCWLMSSNCFIYQAPTYTLCMKRMRYVGNGNHEVLPCMW